MSSTIKHDRRDLDTSGITAVEVATFNGELTVDTGASQSYMDITVRGSAILDIERIDQLLYIRASKKGLSFAGSEVDLHVHLPEDLALTLANVNGPITLRGRARHVEARTYNGTVRTQSTGPAAIHAHVASGRVEILSADGPVHVSAGNGQVHITDCAAGAHIATANGMAEVLRTNGRVHISTANGSIRIEDCAGEFQINSANSFVTWEHVTLQGGSRNWIKSSAGAVEIGGLRAPEGVEIRVKSIRQPVRVDLPGYEVEAHRGRLVASLAGRDSARLEISTLGDVSISV